MVTGSKRGQRRDRGRLWNNNGLLLGCIITPITVFFLGCLEAIGGGRGGRVWSEGRRAEEEFGELVRGRVLFKVVIVLEGQARKVLVRKEEGRARG